MIFGNDVQVKGSQNVVINASQDTLSVEGDQQVVLNAPNGVYINTGEGMVVSATEMNGGWGMVADRTLKTNFIIHSILLIIQDGYNWMAIILSEVKGKMWFLSLVIIWMMKKFYDIAFYRYKIATTRQQLLTSHRFVGGWWLVVGPATASCCDAWPAMASPTAPDTCPSIMLLGS